MRRGNNTRILFVFSVIAAMALGFLGARTVVEHLRKDNSAPETTSEIFVVQPEITETIPTIAPEIPPAITPVPTPKPLPLHGVKIGIDAGHQGKGNTEKEHVAPDSSEVKDKVSSGTAGRFTGVPEHAVTLAVALLLQSELEALGAEIVMVRKTPDVDISNVQRATMMNDKAVDLCIRIHADGSDNPADHGASMQLPSNESTSAINAKSRDIGSNILKEFIKETGARDLGLFERTDLSGFNWSTVPVVLIELGFMTNKDEDELLVTPAYQEKCASGIAKGVLSYYAGRNTDEQPTSLDYALDSFFEQKNSARSDNWAVCVIDTASGSSVSVLGKNNENPVIAASLIKLFIAGAVYYEETANSDFSIDSAKLTKLEMMLRDSDNGAANELVEALGNGDFSDGAQKVNAFAKDIGCNDTELNRRFITEIGGAVNVENHTTVSDCAKALNLLAQGSFVSQHASDQVYAFLRDDATWNLNKETKIRAGIAQLDPDGKVVVANKTGENSPPTTKYIVENDIAIVNFGDTQYILCIMSNSSDQSEAKETIKQLTAIVHRYFIAQEGE